MTTPTGKHDERFVRHARTFAIITLVSRIFGLIRDALTARVLGTSAVATAFNNAFQFPNTFRRLFGEGALSAAFIPEYTQLTRDDPAMAHRFASLVIGAMSVLLGGLTLVVILILLGVLATVTLPEDGRRAVVLLVLMLPYMPLVCVTAILGGMLQVHGRFAAQAGAPVILNVCTIAAVAIVGVLLGASQWTVALVTSIAVTLAGVLQLLWCLRDLSGRAVWSKMVEGARTPTKRMLARMGPVMLGLGAMQLCVLIESQVLLAWPLYVGGSMVHVPWASEAIAYPLDTGAGAVLGYAQRLYQFPLGVFGIALATAVFPLLARQSNDPGKFLETLRRSIRLSLFIGLPATAGMLLVRTDLVAVLFLGKKFTADDVERTAHVLMMYAMAIGAFSLTHVLTRAFYAKGLMALPTKLALVTVVLTLALDVVLMWPMREAGLALSASIAAGVQCALLLWFAHRMHPGMPTLDRATLLSVGRTVIGTALMVVVLLAGARIVPHPHVGDWTGHLIRLAADVVIGGSAYMGYALVFSRTELGWMTERPSRKNGAGSVDSSIEA